MKRFRGRINPGIHNGSVNLMKCPPQMRDGTLSMTTGRKPRGLSPRRLGKESLTSKRRAELGSLWSTVPGGGSPPHRHTLPAQSGGREIVLPSSSFKEIADLESCVDGRRSFPVSKEDCCSMNPRRDWGVTKQCGLPWDPPFGSTIANPLPRLRLLQDSAAQGKQLNCGD